MRTFVAGRTFVVTTILLLSASISPLSLKAQVLECPADAASGDAVANSLLTKLIPTLNYAWTKAAPKVDPLYPADPSNPPGLMFGTGNQRVGCSSDADTLCFLGDEFYPKCDHISAYLNGYDLTGMSQFGLQFKDVAATKQNPKSLATHANRGPDAGLVTDGVFGAEGDTWNDTTYAVLLPLVGSAYGVTVDLGSVITSICGGASTCKGPVFQGDKNAYLLEYSVDGSQWQCYGQFAAGTSSGLRTRGASTLTASGCPTAVVQNFGARYLRVSAYSGDGNYSVSELQVHDTSGNLLTLYKPAVGPLPAQIVSGTPVPDGTSWNDHRAVILPSIGPAHALVVDMGAIKTLCGSTRTCAGGPIVQADRNLFQVEYSTDSHNWFFFGQIAAVNQDGLQNRPFSASSTSPVPEEVSARYVRIWAVSGNGDYSVSSIRLVEAIGAGLPIPLGIPTYGPEPFVTNGEFAPDGTTNWNDPRYATVLRLCSTPNSVCPTTKALTAPLIVDLGSAFPVTQLTLQADRHSFQVDISNDRAVWNPLYTFPTVSGSGLLTRDSPVLPAQTGRYLRVYGVQGDDSNYSVSELQVFTPVANTPCSYQDPDPNAAQNFSCSYDGQFTYDLNPGTTAAMTFKVYSGEVNIICTNGLFSNTLRVATASKNSICKANVSGPTNSSGGLTYPTGDFCAGTCQSASAETLAPTNVLTYAQFPTSADSLPKFKATNVSCPIDSDFDKLITGLFEGVAGAAMSGALNGVLAPNTATPAGIMPQPAACATVAAPSIEATSTKGTVSQVGSGTDNGQIQISGRFTAPDAFAVGGANFTLTTLLQEFGPAGELVGASDGRALLPLTLQPSGGSTADSVIYETPSSVRPRLHFEVATRNRKKNIYDFVLSVDGVRIPAGPTICGPRGKGNALIKTAFILAGSEGPDVSVSATMDWTCHGDQLRAK